MNDHFRMLPVSTIGVVIVGVMIVHARMWDQTNAGCNEHGTKQDWMSAQEKLGKTECNKE